MSGYEARLEEYNPFGLDPTRFMSNAWARYQRDHDITLLSPVTLIVASKISAEEAVELGSTGKAVLLIQANCTTTPQRDIVFNPGTKYDGQSAFSFGGETYVARLSDKTLARVNFRPGRGFEIVHSPRWWLANPDAFDEHRRQLIENAKLERAKV